MPDDKVETEEVKEDSPPLNTPYPVTVEPKPMPKTKTKTEMVSKPIAIKKGPAARSIHFEKSKAYEKVELPPDLWNKEDETEEQLLKRASQEYTGFSASYYVKDNKQGDTK